MPGAISKELFYKKINDDIDCSVVHYWNPDCKTAFLDVLPNAAKGAATFFLPVFLLRLFIDYKRKKKNLLKKFLEREIRAVLYGVSMAGILITSVCSLNKIFGGIHYYTLILLPGMLSGLSLVVESDDNQTLNTLIFFNSCIETILNRLQLSTKHQTILFMAVSGILMHFLETRKEELDCTYWWFYTPALQKNSTRINQKSCLHYETCRRFCFKGFLNYFTVGAGINITKRLLGNIRLIPKYPKKLLDVLFHKSNIYFGLFVGAYVGLYRVVKCYLAKSQLIDSKWHHFVSGTLSALTYTFYPAVQVPILAITTLLQILYHKLCKKFKITNHFYQRLLLFQALHGFNLHNKFLFHNTCSPYYDKMIDACSNNLTKKIFEHVITNHLLVK